MATAAGSIRSPLREGVSAGEDDFLFFFEDFPVFIVAGAVAPLVEEEVEDVDVERGEGDFFFADFDAAVGADAGGGTLLEEGEDAAAGEESRGVFGDAISTAVVASVADVLQETECKRWDRMLAIEVSVHLCTRSTFYKEFKKSMSRVFLAGNHLITKILLELKSFPLNHDVVLQWNKE